MTAPCPRREEIAADAPAPRTFEDLRTSGLLWAVNKVLLHPRGFALALHFPEGATLQQIEAHEVEPIGWTLAGTGAEVWQFAPDMDDEGFAAFEALLADHRAPAPPATPDERPEGTGPCPVPDCTTPGAHVHRPWELAEAQGRLTPEVAAEWSADTWRRFLTAYGVSQTEALHAVRQRAKKAGWSLPWSLGSIAGRPQLAEVLLTMAKSR